MRSSIVLDVLCASIVFGATAGSALAAPEPTTVRDPLFGLTYRPAHEPFDRLPDAVKDACPALTTEQWDRRAWVYGFAQEGTRRYYVIGGYFVQRTPGRLRPDSQGAVFVVDQENCTLLGPAREVFETRSDTIPAPTLERLGRDVRDRYARAFHGEDGFEQQLRRQHATKRSVDELIGPAGDGTTTPKP